MAFTEDGNNGDMTGVTPVEIVPAPSAGTRRIVKTVTIHNPRAGGTVMLTLAKVDTFGSTSIYFSSELEPGDTAVGEEIMVLLENQSLQAYLDVPPSLQPQFTASWGDAS
jgi:hypothetical protein